MTPLAVREDNRKVARQKKSFQCVALSNMWFKTEIYTHHYPYLTHNKFITLEKSPHSITPNHYTISN